MASEEDVLPELFVDAKSECGNIELLEETDTPGWGLGISSHLLILPCSGTCEGLDVPVMPP